MRTTDTRKQPEEEDGIHTNCRMSLLQAIVMKDFTLPIMLLNQSNLTIAESQEAKCTGTFCCCANDGHVKNLFEPFLVVLSHCNKPTALFDVLLPVVNR